MFENYSKHCFILQILLYWRFWYVSHPDNEGKSSLYYYMARYCTFVSPKCLLLLTNCFTTNPHSTVFFTRYNDNDDECTLSHFIFINLQVITFNGNALFAKCVTDCVARPCTFHQSHLTIKLSNMFISKIWRYIAIHTS